ncbi:serine hydrolase [uncultured Croceitalea sp.]|uniref:serine hydrolase n=1 Tax=uncultured Croceitalea sp. TaxID=1798908 RepID=UPI003305F629
MKAITIVLLLFLSITSTFGQKNNIEKIKEVLDTYEQLGFFHGSVLVYEKGELLLSKGYGRKNSSVTSKNDANSVYRIYSTTKIFTATVILQLQEQGKLKLSDRLSKYYPNFPSGHDITIESLLTHTSGIPNDTDPEHTKSETVFLDFIIVQPLDFSPGSRWNYSNSAYYLLGYIIEKVAKMPYEEAVNHYIFQPCKMNQSGFAFKSMKGEQKTQGFEYLTLHKHKTALVYDEPHPFAAGAMYSTTGDLLKFYKGLREHQLLKTETLQKATSEYMGHHYGLGWETYPYIHKKAVGHSGGGPGFKSRFKLIFEEDICVIVLSNTETNKNLDSMILSMVLANDPKEDFITPAKVAHEKLLPFKGTYTLEDSKFLIYLNDGVLSFHHSKYTSSRSLLAPKNDSIFFTDVIMNGTEGNVFFKFKTNGKNEVDFLEVSFPNGEKKIAYKESTSIPWGIIGSATKSGWEGNDILMEPDKDNPDVFKLDNVKLQDGEFKFRVNNDWNINLGLGIKDGLIVNGGNLTVTEGTYTIMLDVSDITKPVYSIKKS